MHAADLKDIGALEHYIDESAVVLIFLSKGTYLAQSLFELPFESSAHLAESLLELPFESSDLLRHWRHFAAAPLNSYRCCARCTPSLMKGAPSP